MGRKCSTGQLHLVTSRLFSISSAFSPSPPLLSGPNNCPPPLWDPIAATGPAAPGAEPRPAALPAPRARRPPRRRSPYRDAVLESDALQRVPGAEPVLHVALGQRRRHARRAAVRAGLGVGQPLRQLGLRLRPARRLLPQRLGHAPAAPQRPRLRAGSAAAPPGMARRPRPLRRRPPGGGNGNNGGGNGNGNGNGSRRARRACAAAGSARGRTRGGNTHAHWRPDAAPAQWRVCAPHGAPQRVVAVVRRLRSAPVSS